MNNMWNATGIWMWIGYIITGIILFSLCFSCGFDCARAEKSKSEGRAEFYRKAFIKVVAVIIAIICWFNFAITIADRDNAHKYNISDKMCVEISAESGWSESDVRGYLTITAKNGGSVEAAIAHIKGED